ncbi:MAG: hypothetical protein VX836_18395 [Pseudomonadota bacterium]|nr:hypothetical protein [Pseudomonadota bacterium]
MATEKSTYTEAHTSQDHQIQIGDCKLLLPAGARVIDVLEDVALFASLAKGMAQEIGNDDSGGDHTSTGWAIAYLATLAGEFANAAINQQMAAEALGGAE